MVNLFGLDVIAIEDFDREMLEHILEVTAKMESRERTGKRYMEDKKKKKALTLFFQPSTRTYNSFRTAMLELGGEVEGFSDPSNTSQAKGESLLMTVKNFELNHPDVVVMRHPKDGSVQWVADALDIPVINAGDGSNQHPTQAFLDLYTIQKACGSIDGVNIGFGGDLKYGRTVHSLVRALSLFDNVSIHWAADDFLAMPEDLEKLVKGRGVEVKRYETIEEVLKVVELMYMTRPQTEWFKDLTPGKVTRLLSDYRITKERLSINPNIKIMHPLPIDKRVAEIDHLVFFEDNQLFLDQAQNGIFLRKALLSEIVGDSYIPFLASLDPILSKPNNRVYLPVHERGDKGERFIGDISDGYVIDHIDSDAFFTILSDLQPEKYRGIFVAAIVDGGRYGRKAIIKFNGELGLREENTVATNSPDATFSEVKGGKVVRKFKAVRCEHSNCISQERDEDIPTKVYLEQGGTLRCRYCRHPIHRSFELENVNIMGDYLKSLPRIPN